MAFEDLDIQLDLGSLRAAYASGALTPELLIESIYTRMEREDALGVWIARVPRAAALAQARALDASAASELPLFGVPFAVKDNIDVDGLPTTAACPGFLYLPERSSSAVEKLVRAGALCLGKVNMDQFATGLVGTRSPYGACKNVFDPSYLAGGSSSGSAVAVALHYVSFSLGTDTAGSGRVPAALNNVVGLKPSLGLLPTDGMVPACASLDCLSIFACTVPDAVRVREVILGQAPVERGAPRQFRFGVPSPLELFGDGRSHAAFERSLARLHTLGGEPVAIDFAPFRELGDLLYGPFVIERQLAVGAFMSAHPDEVLPVTRAIIESGDRFDAQAAFRAFAQVTALKRRCLEALESVDVLVTPTAPTHFTRAQDRAEPRAVNDKLGIYTRFVNFVGSPVLSIPQDFRDDGLPFGISLVGLPGRDNELDGLADQLHRAADAGFGRLRLSPPSQQSYGRAAPEQVRLAVVGAHMHGLALHTQLAERRARYVATVRTAPRYRLYVLPGTKPERPGLVRVAEGGSAIELELWDLGYEELGSLMARIPRPLTIGTVETADGELVRGFLCESYAIEGATEISSFGGYRAYLAGQSESHPSG